MIMKQWCRIWHFNIAFYAAIMGFGWLSLATHKLEQVYVTHTHVSLWILLFTILMFLIVSWLYITKLFLNFREVKVDFYHPVKSNFFPWIGKILMIFAIALLSVSPDIALWLRVSGVIVQSIFSILLFRRWMLHEMDIKEMNPLWFLPVVGNILVPVAGVHLWYEEISWFFFVIGMAMRITFFIIIMNRIIFHPALPQKLFPTLIILIAPPAVASLSYTVLNGGEVDQFGKSLYYFALFLFVIVLSKVTIFAKLKFFMSRWAYSFPLAVLATSTLLWYSKLHYAFLWYLSVVIYLLLRLVMFLLVVHTIIGIRRRNICIEE